MIFTHIVQWIKERTSLVYILPPESALSPYPKAAKPLREPHWSRSTGRRDQGRRAKIEPGTASSGQASASPLEAPPRQIINTSNAWTLTPATPNYFLLRPSSPPLTLPRLFSGSAASSSPSSWSTVCSSAVPQARQPRDSPLHRLFRQLHIRAGAPHFPSGPPSHPPRNAHTPTSPCYKQQCRSTTRRTRLCWGRLSHSPYFRPAHLSHKLRNLRLLSQSVPAFRMLFVQVSRLQRIR